MIPDNELARVMVIGDKENREHLEQVRQVTLVAFVVAFGGDIYFTDQDQETVPFSPNKIALVTQVERKR